MTEPLVLITQHEHICHIQLNRAEKHNAANKQMLAELAQAFTAADVNSVVRVVVVSAVGPHFTAGLDIPDVLSDAQTSGISLIPDGSIDPWAMSTPRISKPVVVAVSGTCFTLGVELILATDIAIADETAVFGQLEVTRGILPFGGATTRFAERCGWGNAMRYMLAGETFDSAEALRIGLIQERVAKGTHIDRAFALARKISQQAPLAVKAILRNAEVGRESKSEAHTQLQAELTALLATEDFAAGVEAFKTRSLPHFEGK